VIHGKSGGRRRQETLAGYEKAALFSWGRESYTYLLLDQLHLLIPFIPAHPRPTLPLISIDVQSKEILTIVVGCRS